MDVRGSVTQEQLPRGHGELKRQYLLLCVLRDLCGILVVNLAATQDSTGDAVTYFAGPAAAAVPVQDAVELAVEGLVHGQRTGCRMLAVQVGTG